MIVLHLDSSTSKTWSEIFKYKGKNLMMQIKLFRNFWIRSESIQGLAEKQAVNND